MVELDQGGRMADRARLYPPPSGLDHIVEHGFVLPTHADQDEEWRIVPDTAAHLLLHVEASGSAMSIRARAVGARSVHGSTSVRDRCYSVGVRLAPGALAALPGHSADELRDRAIPLQGWPHRGCVETRDAASSAPVPEHLLHALFDWLGRVVEPAPRPDWRISGYVRLLDQSPTLEVASAARELGVGVRTLRRVCREAVGLGPKRIARIHRLHRALRLARAGRPGGAVAAAAGYADQPHMVREFGALLGESPGAYLRRRHAS